MTSKLQYPNCFLIEQLFSNMEINNKNSIPVSLQILNNNGNNQHSPLEKTITHQNQQFQEFTITSPTSFYQSCTKHKNTKGEFYQTQYPWIRYCQNCALNLALCGKKIQKFLSSQQMYNKITLSQILRTINASIKQCQQTHQNYSILSARLHQYRHEYANVISQIDNYIKKVMQIRNQLQLNVQNNINKEIKQICQKQTNIIGHKMQLIKQKSHIQCGFVEFISCSNIKDQKNEQSQKSSVQQIIQRCQRICQQTKLLTENKQSFEQLLKKLNQNVNFMDGLFGDKIFEIKTMCDSTIVGKFVNKSGDGNDYCSGQKFQLQFATKKDRFFNDLSGVFNSHCSNEKIKNKQNELQIKFSNTNPSISQVQLNSSNSEQIFTSFSTIRNSALISPCCELNNGPQNVLTQQTQNRKTTRAALQLKSRCKSKSGHKRKVDVNVRQNLENFNKKKSIV